MRQNSLILPYGVIVTKPDSMDDESFARRVNLDKESLNKPRITHTLPTGMPSEQFDRFLNLLDEFYSMESLGPKFVIWSKTQPALTLHHETLTDINESAEELLKKYMHSSSVRSARHKGEVFSVKDTESLNIQMTIMRGEFDVQIMPYTATRKFILVSAPNKAEETFENNS